MLGKRPFNFLVNDEIGFSVVRVEEGFNLKFTLLRRLRESCVGSGFDHCEDNISFIEFSFV
jgi:hypothetical protein